MRAALVGRCIWFTEPLPDRSTGTRFISPGDAAVFRPPTCDNLPPPIGLDVSTFALSGRPPVDAGILWRLDASRFNSAKVRLSKFCCDLESMAARDHAASGRSGASGARRSALQEGLASYEIHIIHNTFYHSWKRVLLRVGCILARKSTGFRP